MTQAIRTLGRVLKHRIAELEQHVVLTQDKRELKKLWKARRYTLKLWRILTGFAE